MLWHWAWQLESTKKHVQYVGTRLSEKFWIFVPLQDKGVTQHLMFINENGPSLLTPGYLLSPKAMHIIVINDHWGFLWWHSEIESLGGMGCSMTRKQQQRQCMTTSFITFQLSLNGVSVKIQHYLLLGIWRHVITALNHLLGCVLS